ncbi:GlsB/YeaQ/YmgE family stress response membrane protein [Mariluticola halotolerans]|uniref:GlsB/YeaQ/YmgE family stress response membrane protein n=1 Tax=Mariluticola halotolerans TaxID=2909283 RepID=UPI0026E2CB47|nr:GlsB/YeaQ/YmgE family stress response membrane protein [Mariluticola halotolerans]UJQ94990.1 GlsB/YeaQ/YmgE family stress response membrane protein [Mariluticola halotolerans]
MAQALLVWAIVGLVAGWLASLFLGGGGIVRYIVVGMIGSIVGGYLFSLLGINIPIANAWVRDILVAAVGAAIVIIVARFVAR